MAQIDNLINQVLNDDFRIVKQIGIGAFSKIYIAEQLSVGKRRVAVKVLHKIHLDNNIERQNSDTLKKEAYYLSILKSPCFPKIYRTGLTNENLPYIAMEYCSGISLEKFIGENAPFKIDTFFTIADQILEGVAELHSNDLIHRDLKPSNILIDKGVYGTYYVKIVDLGIAKSVYDKEKMSAKFGNDWIGTPAYMAPEQASQQSTDEKCDIFTIGSIFYEMLTGMRAIHIKNPSIDGYIEYLRSEKPIPTYKISTIKPDVPYEIENIIMKALYRPRDKRWGSVWEMRKNLKPAVERVYRSEVSTNVKKRGIIGKLFNF